jgi:hypothetical protein
VEHLVVCAPCPPSGSPDTRFEALVARAPRPASKTGRVYALLLRRFEGDPWRDTAGPANAVARRLGDAVAG